MKKKLFSLFITLIIVFSPVIPVLVGPGDRVRPSYCEYPEQACVVVIGIVATRGGPGNGGSPPPPDEWP
ncbi:MAG: hypothetical protein FWC73_13450 [Defluviitaleaceae bacterium]|nr:hypothetical protein [Defluviitaleaceae bacterium]